MYMYMYMYMIHVHIDITLDPPGIHQWSVPCPPDRELQWRGTYETTNEKMPELPWIAVLTDCLVSVSEHQIEKFEITTCRSTF